MGSTRSPVALVLDAMLSGKLVFLLSPVLLDEYRSVLLRPKLAELHGLTETQIDQLLVELTANALWREPQSGSPAHDRDYDHLWALLMLSAYPESILLTGDRLLAAGKSSDTMLGDLAEYMAWRSCQPWRSRAVDPIRYRGFWLPTSP